MAQNAISISAGVTSLMAQEDHCVIDIGTSNIDVVQEN